MKRSQFRAALQRIWSKDERRAARSERLLRPFWLAADPGPAPAADVLPLSAARRRAR
jgi:hypothetical protein